jgi:hypothetical protein
VGSGGLLGLLAFEFFDEGLGEAFALWRRGDFGGGCERAEFGVGGDFFDGRGVAGGFGGPRDVQRLAICSP